MQFNTENTSFNFTVEHLIVAGWTGRDAKAVQHHIDELAAIGVAPPSKVPLFYRVSNDLLTTDPLIEVLGDASSGEAEPMIVRHGGTLWLGLGSDHTDRQLEATSVAASKQICAKPCAATLWDYATVADRLETITIQSWIHENGDWVLYQDGHLGQIRPLEALITPSIFKLARQCCAEPSRLSAAFALPQGFAPPCKIRRRARKSALSTRHVRCPS